MLDDDNNTTSETIILKLSTRAGIPAALVPSDPNNIPSQSPLTQLNRNNQPVEINVQILPNHPIADDYKTKNPTRLIRTNDDIDARIVSLSSGYQTRSRNSDNIGSTTTLSPIPSDIDSQRKRILNFVVSDAQPQSFQPRPSTTSTSTTTTTTTTTTTQPPQYSEQLGRELGSKNAFVNRQASIKSYPTTTTNAPNVLISGIHLPPNRLPKNENIKLVLTSGLRDVSNEEVKQPEVEQGTVEIIPLYIRESNGRPLVDATVEPTTYAPAKPFRSVKRPAVQSDTIVELDSQDGEESMTNIQKRPYEQSLETAADASTPASASKLVSKFSYKYLDERNYRNKPFINEPTPYFTSRSNNFKEVLNKTYETSTTSKLFVSPYTSLRSILQDESVKSTSLRPVIRPSPISNKNQTLPSSSPPPFRSYYSITNTPRSTSTSSTTHRLIKSTTTEPSTTESTTTTTKSTIPTTTVSAPKSDVWIPLSSTEIDRYVKSPKFIQHNIRNQFQSFSTTENSVDSDEPTTYAPYQPENAYRRKIIRTRPVHVSSTPPPVEYDDEDNNDEALDVIRNDQFSKLLESVLDNNKPKKYEARRGSNHVEPTTTTTTERYLENIFDSTTRIIEITDRPHQYFSHYRHLSTERTVGSAISSTQRYVNHTTTPKLSDEQLREKFRATVEMPEFNIPTESERKMYKQNAAADDVSDEFDLTTLTNTITEVTTQSTSTTTVTAKPSRTTTVTTTTTTEELPVPSTSYTPKSSSTTNSINTIPPRASRVNAAIKTTIAAASLPRRVTSAPVTLKCTENSPNAKCNEIPSRYHRDFLLKFKIKKKKRIRKKCVRLILVCQDLRFCSFPTLKNCLIC